MGFFDNFEEFGKHDVDIAIVADMLNASLRPDGWDIGALENIAEYAAARGMCIYDHDDPTLEWNQANYEGKQAQDMSYDDGASGAEPLEEWAEEVLNKTQEEQLEQDIYDVFTSKQSGHFKWTIEVELTGLDNNVGFAKELAGLIAFNKITNYDLRMEETRNPIRLDNCPF